MSLYSPKYYAEHREEINAKQLKYYAEHREEINAKHRKYSTEHREEINAKHRKYSTEHREEINAKLCNYKPCSKPLKGKRYSLHFCSPTCYFHSFDIYRSHQQSHSFLFNPQSEISNQRSQ